MADNWQKEYDQRERHHNQNVRQWHAQMSIIICIGLLSAVIKLIATAKVIL